MNYTYQYSNQFFDELVLFEDVSRGHCYKTYIRQSVLEFLKDETKENAFAVYETFFDSYRITMEGKSNPFIDLMDILRRHEENAALLIDRQRDHYIHSVNVFILGLCVYSQNANYRSAFNTTILDKSVYPYSYDTNHEEFFYRWGLTSLFHDLGYPVEIIGKQLTKYMDFVTKIDKDRKFNAHLAFENFDELNSIAEVPQNYEFTQSYREKFKISKVIDLYKPIDLLAHKLHISLGVDLQKTKAGLDGFIGVMAKNRFIDHGFFSAIIILKWYGFLIQSCNYKPDYFFYPVLDSASAILLHNYYKNVIMKPPFSRGCLSPYDHPIAYLLILCDELQEWNREAYGIVDKTGVHAGDASLMITDKHLDVTYITNKGIFPEQFSTEKEDLITKILDIGTVFNAGFTVGCESVEALSELARDLKRDELILPRPLLENLEKLAIAIHEKFNQVQIERHPGEPLEYPNFSDLPDTLQYSNLRQARCITKMLELAGWEMRPLDSGGAVVEEIPVDMIEKLALDEHNNWVRERLSSGWLYTEVKNVDKKTSPYLVPYEKLPEEIKDLDRDIIRNIPSLLSLIGMAVYIKKE